MSKGIFFNGFEHFTRGSADISVNNDKLVVSDLSKSTDGVIISANGVSGMQIDFEPFELPENANFGATFNMRDNFGRIKTIAQWAIAPKKGDKCAKLMVNSRLEGENIQVIGMKGGKVVFVQNILNDKKDPYCNWIAVAVIVIVATSVVLSNIDIKKKRVVYRDANGKIIKVEEVTEKSFGGGNSILPQINLHASPKPVVSSTAVDCDKLYVVSSKVYPGKLDDDLDGAIEEIEIMTDSNKPITIINETSNVIDPYKYICSSNGDDTEYIVCQ